VTNVTLADGTSWNQAAGCTSSIATNLLATEENQQDILRPSSMKPA